MTVPGDSGWSLLPGDAGELCGVDAPCPRDAYRPEATPRESSWEAGKWGQSTPATC